MSDAKFEAAERPLDETFSGPEYRTWRDALLLEAAKFTDKSGSSLADRGSRSKDKVQSIDGLFGAKRP